MTPEEILKIKEAKGKRAIFYYESAKRSVLAAEVLLGRLEAELEELELLLPQGTNIADKLGPVLITVMGIVDFAHRFGELMEGMPLLSKSVRQVHLRKLREALLPVREVRNHLQHLREELSLGAAIQYPLMGSVTWVRGEQCYAVGLQTQGFNVEFPSMAYGAFGIGYVAKYQYTAASQLILLDPLVATMRESFDWLASIVHFTDPNYDKVGWGQAVAFSSSMTVEVSPIENSDD